MSRYIFEGAAFRLDPAAIPHIHPVLISAIRYPRCAQWRNMFFTRRRPSMASQLHPAQPARRRLTTLALVTVATLGGFAAATVAQAQDTFKPPPPVTYTEKYEVYGGFNFANGQAGQNLPKRYNMAGGEVMGTYWLTPKWGVAADGRFEGGTTPVLPSGQATNPPVQTRPYVSQIIGMGGAQYHWFGNQHAGVNLHALAGVANGDFDHSNPNLVPALFQNATGLYSNRTSFMGTAGGSIDFNRSARWAIRLSPEIVFEHFGTELREFVYVSGGVIYRFGNR
jgi:hypothetical protein